MNKKPTLTIIVFPARLMMQWRLTRGQEAQTRHFLEDFSEVVLLEWLKCFEERELEVVVCGMQEIDISDWHKHTIYPHYNRSSKQIIWFWQMCVDLVPVLIIGDYTRLDVVSP